MSTTEERLHAAIARTAAEIAPGTLPPLTLPAPGRPARDWRRSRGMQRPGWRRVAAPLAAAASVVAVVTILLALTSSDGSRGPAPATGGLTGQTALASVPPYYVTLTGYTGDLNAHFHAAVRATATGKTLATVSPPRPYQVFTWVSGAGDDRTFVLAAQRWEKGANVLQDATKFFLLRAHPAKGTARLTALPVSEKSGDGVIAMSLSPDASKLAVVLNTPHSLQTSRKIQVLSLATGAQHTWTWTGPGWVGSQDSFSQPLSWAADSRTLAFQQWTGNQLGVRLLDTAGAGHSLRSARLAVSIPSSNNDGSNSLLTPDGTRIIYAPAVTLPPVTTAVHEKLNFAVYSAHTGKLLQTRDPWWFNVAAPTRPGQSVLKPWQQVLWSDTTGHTLIVVSPPGQAPAGQWVHHSVRPVIGVLSGNHFTPIPRAPNANQNIDSVAW
jgi:hypothetical protein